VIERTIIDYTNAEIEKEGKATYIYNLQTRVEILRSTTGQHGKRKRKRGSIVQCGAVAEEILGTS